MCKCTPQIRTPYCGKGDCQWPHEKPEGTRSTMTTNPELPDDVVQIRIDDIKTGIARARAALAYGNHRLIDIWILTLADQIKSLEHAYQSDPTATGALTEQIEGLEEAHVELCYDRLKIRKDHVYHPIMEAARRYLELSKGGG